MADLLGGVQLDEKPARHGFFAHLPGGGPKGKACYACRHFSRNAPPLYHAEMNTGICVKAVAFRGLDTADLETTRWKRDAVPKIKGITRACKYFEEVADQ